MACPQPITQVCSECHTRYAADIVFIHCYDSIDRHAGMVKGSGHTLFATPDPCHKETVSVGQVELRKPTMCESYTSKPLGIY